MVAALTCLWLKILLTIIVMAGLGYLGLEIGDVVGAVVGALGGFILTYFWLSTFILFFC